MVLSARSPVGCSKKLCLARCRVRPAALLSDWFVPTFYCLSADEHAGGPVVGMGERPLQ
jgi:hypothetical protein